MAIRNLLIFPRAFAIAIDDLGWNEGGNLSMNVPSGPYRVGIKRNFTLNDYISIINVGKAIGVRIQCLFILGEMDRENILAKYPTTTNQGNHWNNSNRVCDEQLEIMKYVCQQSAHMEFGLHGSGHEYWAADGIQRRAEWYNMADRHPWPEDEMRSHIQAFKEIMAQYNLSSEYGHSFPESFVACAYSHYWNPTGSYSIGKLVSEVGVKYANTDFSQIPELSPPQEVNGGGFDNGLHVINRMNYGNLWYEIDTLPKVTIDMQHTDIIESHWANWLAQDDFMQPAVNHKWAQYYRYVQGQERRYIAKNTEQLHSQWLYKKYTIIKQTSDGVVEIDNTYMPKEVYQNEMLGNIVFKLKCQPGEYVTKTILNDEPISAYYEDGGYSFLYLPPLERKKYTLQYVVGKVRMTEFVYNDGTYNVYRFEKSDSSILLTLKMYGEQIVKVKCDNPSKVISLSKGLMVIDFTYSKREEMVHIKVKATDFQGVRGQIKLQLN